MGATTLMKQIVSSYLYGSLTPPTEQELLEDDIIRPSTQSVIVYLNTSNYMSSGAGRFAKGSQFEVIEEFFEQTQHYGSVPTGTYTFTQILSQLGLNDPNKNYANASIDQKEYSGGGDYLERVFVFNNSNFGIDLSLNPTFNVDSNGKGTITDLRINPLTDNWDFEGGDVNTNSLNEAIMPFIDPSAAAANDPSKGLGRQVSIQFSGNASTDANYTYSEYANDALYISNQQDNPDYVYLLGLFLPDAINDLWDEGYTKFVDEKDRPVLYGTENGDTIDASSIDTLYDDWLSYFGTWTMEDFIERKDNGIAIIAGDGDDTLYGEIYTDWLRGGEGDDMLYGEDGNDELDGGRGNNTLNGGKGFETISYDYAFDVLTDADPNNDIEFLIATNLKANGDYTVTRTIHDGNGGTLVETDILLGIERIAHAEKQIERVGSTDYKDMQVAEISGGYVAVFSAYDNSGDYFVKYQLFDYDGNVVANAGNLQGDPTNVSNAGTNEEKLPRVTGTSDGGFAVTWHEYTTKSKTLVRAFHSDGQPKFGDVEAFENPLPSDPNYNNNGYYTTEYEQDITSLSNGHLVVVSRAYGNSTAPLQLEYTDVIVRVVDGTTGALIGNKSIANTSQGEYQTHPRVTGLDNGDFVVTWYSSTSYSSTEGVFFQRYNYANNDFTKVGSEVQVHQHTYGYESNPDIAGLDDGGFVIVWEDSNSYSIGGYATDIYFSRYDASGTVVAGQQEIRVNTNVSNGQSDPSVSALEDGGFIITYTDHNAVSGGSGSIVMAQQYNDNGDTRAENFMVNVTTASTANKSAISSLDNGDFVVGWADSSHDFMNRVYSLSDSELVA